MSKRLNIEEVKARLKIINPNIKILSNEYTNNNTKLKCKCKLDNYIWEAKWSSLSQGFGCPFCGGKIKLTLKEIKLKLLYINPNIEILADKYFDSKSKLKCLCKIDKYEWEVNWHNLQYGKGCPKCANLNRIEKRTLTQEEIKKIMVIKNPNIEFLGMSKRKIKNRMRKIIKCKCKIDGYEWETSWDSLTEGNGCPQCYKETTLGENHFNWKGGISPLHEYIRHKIINWKRDSMKLCNYKCAITGEKFDVIHHVIGFNQILQETLDFTKLPLYQEIAKYTDIELRLLEETCLALHYKYGLGICLTENMHKEFHAIYGYGNNTKEQFEVFKQIQLSNNNEAS